MQELKHADAALVERLAEQLDRSPSEVLDALLTPPEEPDHIATVVEEGTFVQLSLRALGPRLRWAQPVGDLTVDLQGLPHVRELDLHGLELTHLDLAPCPRLERLVLSENALHHLDVTMLPALDHLDVAANTLMLLDLRHQTALTSLEASGNELTGLLLPTSSPLRVLRATRNQLMVLDLGDTPALVELKLSRNALVDLRLDAPSLRHLDLHDNQLTELVVPAQLLTLKVSRNRLATLDLQGAARLRSLDVAHNYLDALDLEDLRALETADLANNQLTSLSLGPSIALAHLDCSGNRLDSLDVTAAPNLQVLHTSANDLQHLDLTRSGALCALDVRANRLPHVDLRGCRRLASADLRDNPLDDVHLPTTRSFTRLAVDGGTAVHGTDDQRHRLLSLRVRAAGLPIPPELNRHELHAWAATYDEPDREVALLGVVTDFDRCALGTAVMVYWMSSPHYYLPFDDRDDVPAYALAGWDLLQTIERNVREGRYVHDDVFFDPRDDQQTVDILGKDWTHPARDAHGRRPPVYMTTPCGHR